MADVDPEVERLADALARTPASVAPTQTDMARMILADLRERYVLVPREGTSTRWEPRWVGPNGGILPASKGGMEQRRRVVYCPWEPADAPLSAQNGPDDSQGHPDRDDA